MARDLDGAFGAMKNIGYHNVQRLGRRCGDAGEVYEATKNNQRLRLKISCHSCKPSRPRYLVQIRVKALENVDRFVLWFEGETCFYDIPARRLNEIFNEHPRIARVAHDQWQVNLNIEQGVFELAAGYRCDFRELQEKARDAKGPADAEMERE